MLKLERAVLRSPFSVLRSPFSVLRSPFSVLRSPLHIRRNFLISALFIALLLTACDDKTDDTKLEQPKDQSDEITIVTELGSFTATVKGVFTDTQWNSVSTTIETAFNNAANDPLTEDAIINVFGNNDVVITVERTTEYTIYKVVANNKKTLYLNINGLGSLQAKVKEASTALSDGTASKE